MASEEATVPAVTTTEVNQLDTLKERLEKLRRMRNDKERKLRDTLVNKINAAVDNDQLRLDLTLVFGNNLKEKHPIAEEVRMELKSRDIVIKETFSAMDRYKPTEWIWEILINEEENDTSEIDYQESEGISICAQQ